jgi:hypothetical protein
VGHKASMDAVGRRKIICYCWEWNPGCPARSLVAIPIVLSLLQDFYINFNLLFDPHISFHLKLVTIVPRTDVSAQRLDKYFPAPKDTHATIKELLKTWSPRAVRAEGLQGGQLEKDDRSSE